MKTYFRHSAARPANRSCAKDDSDPGSHALKRKTMTSARISMSNRFSTEVFPSPSFPSRARIGGCRSMISVGSCCTRSLRSSRSSFQSRIGVSSVAEEAPIAVWAPRRSAKSNVPSHNTTHIIQQNQLRPYVRSKRHPKIVAKGNTSHGDRRNGRSQCPTLKMANRPPGLSMTGREAWPGGRSHYLAHTK